ncbi:MAG: FtsX-like permease family protein [Thermoplasmata archaeon]
MTAAAFRRRPARPHARIQLVLAAAAIATAVALPVVLVSVGGGVSAHELHQIQQTGYAISVSAAGSHGILGAHGLARQILGISGVLAASPVLSAPLDAFLLANGQPTAILAEGVIPDQFAPTLGPGEGALFPVPLPLGDPTDAAHFANGTYAGPASYDVILATPIAEAAHLAPGDRIRLGPTDNLRQSVVFNVTGTFGVSLSGLSPTGAFALLMPLSDLQVMTGTALGGANGTALLDAADTIQIAVAPALATDPGAIASVAAQVQRIVPYYGVTTQLQEARQIEQASAILTAFYLALSSVGLVVGLVFLAVVLVRRVDSERRAIGIRRALGLPPRGIAASFAVRGAALALLGVVAGTFGGWAIVTLLARFAGGTVSEAASLAVFDPVLLSAIGAAIVGLGALVSLAATRRALALDLVEVLR